MKKPDFRRDDLEIMKVIAFIAAGALLLALIPWPYGFYTLLRIGITVASLVITILLWNAQRKVQAVLLAPVALLFNPIVPVYLDRETWMAIDVIMAVVFGCIGFYAHGQLEEQDAKSINGKRHEQVEQRDDHNRGRPVI